MRRTLNTPELVAKGSRAIVREHRIVKSPAGGMPARVGTTVTPVAATIYDVVANVLTTTGVAILVYNVTESAIPEDDYAIAQQQPDKTWAVEAGGIGVNFTFVKTIGTLQPGGTTTGDVVIWDFATSAWIDDPAFGAPVTINDSTISNFLSPNEIVRTAFNVEMDNYDIVGSRGLIQRGTVGADVEPNATVVVTLFSPLTGTLSGVLNRTGWGLKSGSDVLCIFEPARGTSHANGYKVGEWNIVDTLTKIVKVQLTVTSPGQFAGDEDTACAFTYTVKNPETGITIATDINPTAGSQRYRREEFGARKAATWGLAELNCSGATNTLELTWINETLDVSACAAAGSSAPAFAADSYEIAAGLELEILSNETMEIT